MPKVVKEVSEDEFCTIREKEDRIFWTKYCPVHNPDLPLSEENFAEAFWVPLARSS